MAAFLKVIAVRVAVALGKGAWEGLQALPGAMVALGRGLWRALGALPAVAVAGVILLPPVLAGLVAGGLAYVLAQEFLGQDEAIILAAVVVFVVAAAANAWWHRRFGL